MRREVRKSLEQLGVATIELIQTCPRKLQDANEGAGMTRGKMPHRGN